MGISLPPESASRGLVPSRRIAAIGLVIGVLVLLGMALQWGNTGTYVTLFRNLEISSVSGLTEALTKGGIPFKLESGGTEVLVKPEDAARARVLLAKDGLPSNGKPGMELFDKPTWGMTDFTQRITYRRALEGELSRTIGTLKGVDKAQVHLTLPESSPLRRTEHPAQAAVVLSLRGGASLSADAVQGIAAIVSNSVEQLPTENVAVMDDSGRLLSGPTDAAGFVGATTRQLDLQHGVEKQLAAKAEEMLATVVGTGQSRVQVAATLNFEQAERTIEAYDPDKAVLQSEQKSETQADSSAGVGAQTIISNQYQNSKTIERVIGSVGTVKRLSVAVLVDEAALGKEATKVGATPAAQIALLEAAVRNAIGVDSVRGDRITVTAMPFEPVVAANVKQLVGDSTKGGRDTLVIVERFSRPGLILVGLIIALILGLRILNTPVRGGGGSLPASAPTPGALAESMMSPEPALAAAGSIFPALPVSGSVQLRRTVQQEASSETETVAQVIKTWLAEREA